MKLRFSLVPKNAKFDNLLKEGSDLAHQAAVAFEKMLDDYPNRVDAAGLMTNSNIHHIK
jgi:hypothetical protein